MEDTTQGQLWQAVHAAYESHDPAEARRLLHDGRCSPDCSKMSHCEDADYIRWLLSNRLVPAEVAEQHGLSLQERQLQCDSLDEADRPRCITHGEWGAADTPPCGH